MLGDLDDGEADNFFTEEENELCSCRHFVLKDVSDAKDLFVEDHMEKERVTHWKDRVLDVLASCWGDTDKQFWKKGI